MKNKTAYIIVGVALIVAGLIFFGGSSQTNRLPAGVSAVGGAQSGAEDGVDEKIVAPDFTLTNINGSEVTLSSFRGEKPVVLDFFATWCPNCRRDMPKLSRIYDEYKSQVEVIGINLQERPDTVRRYADNLDVSFPLVLDPTASVARQYGVQYTNFHVLINTDGTVFGIVPGDIAERDVQDLIAAQRENNESEI